MAPRHEEATPGPASDPGPRMRAWHFARAWSGVPTMRNGEPIRVGRLYEVPPPLRPCMHGLHASERPLDALAYAPGLWVSRVELDGEIVQRLDRLCATRRRHLWIANAHRCIGGWAAWCARRVLHVVPAAQRTAAERSIELVEGWSIGESVAAEAVISALAASSVALLGCADRQPAFFAARAALAALGFVADPVPVHQAHNAAWSAAAALGGGAACDLEHEAQDAELGRRLVALGPPECT